MTMVNLKSGDIMKKAEISWQYSLLSLIWTLFLTLSVQDWHSRSTNRHEEHEKATTYQRLPQQSHNEQRSLLMLFSSLSKSPSNIDDDITRDGICRQYLYNFLNGTTDAKDECDGMYHAFEAADCASDALTQQQQQRHDIPRYSPSPPSYISQRQQPNDSNSFLQQMIFHPHKHDDGNITDDNVVIDDSYHAWECCSSIYHYYTKHCHEPEFASKKLLGIVLVMIVCFGIKGLLRTFGWEWIPDAAACILVGAVVGGSLRIVSPSMMLAKNSFNNDLFLRILLPPIVFQSALSIDKRAFRRDLFPILTFAVLGTLLSTIMIGLVTFWLTSLRGPSLPLLDSLLFGSLISSIDPVATLGILLGAGVNPTDTLYTLVFGESLLNDGVAIVLFETLVRHLGDTTVVTKATVYESLQRFAVVSAGSIAIGLICGFICTLYFMALRGKHSAVTEVAVFFCWALIPYYISDAAGLSGIIAIMAMGFFLDYFVIGGCQSEEGQWLDYIELRRDQSQEVQPPLVENNSCCCRCLTSVGKTFSGCGHLSSRSRKHIDFVAELVSSIMETAIFVYLGLFLFQDRDWDLRLNSTAVFGCVSSRAVMVLLVSFLVNTFVWLDLENRLSRLGTCLLSCFCSCKRPHRDDDEEGDDVVITTKVYLDQKTQLILLLAGVRGAVSFALAENIPVYDAVTKHGSKYKSQIKAMTASSIMVTLFVFGALTYFTVRKQQQQQRDADQVVSRLTRRLLSVPLASTLEDDDHQGRGSDGSSSQSSSGAGEGGHRRSRR